MTTHRPTDDMIFEYAAGTLPEPVALAVAVQASLDAETRRAIRAAEGAGGALVEALPEAALAPGALDACLARLDDAVPAPPAATITAATRALLPAPLWPLVGGDIAGVAWKARSAAVKAAVLPSSVPGYDVRLLRIKAGAAVPRHTHRGLELTLVLKGAYRDGALHFAKGDLQIADPSIEHRPVADAGEECLCFVVLGAPIRLTGPLGRFVDRFVRV
jgi:putative transcriptional regulator